MSKHLRSFEHEKYLYIDEELKDKEKYEPTTLIDLKTALQLANNRYKDKLNRLSVDIGKNLQ